MKTISKLICGALLASALWAADPTGQWTATMQGPSGETRTLTIHLQASGSQLTGTVSGLGGSAGDAEISKGHIEGDQISFSVVRGQFTMNYQGTLTGDEIRFQMVGDRDQASAAGSKRPGIELQAHRNKP